MNIFFHKKVKTVALGVFIALMGLLLLSGCGLGANDENERVGSGNQIDNNNDNEMLPDNSTSNDQNEPVNNGEFDDPEALWNKTEYDAPTGEWFMHNGKGLFGYGLPFGTLKGGDEFTVSLYGHNPEGEQLDRTIRITLTERSDEFEILDTVLEEEIYVDLVKEGDQQIFSSTVPEKENAKYVLSVQVVNDAGEVEDTLLSLIKVPKEEINATMHADKEVYGADDTEITLIVKNDGPTDLFFGVYYTIEQLVDGEWKQIQLDTAFIDIAIMLEAGKEYEQKVNIEPLEAGSYRIYKEVHADGFDLTEKLMVEFTIN